MSPDNQKTGQHIDDLKRLVVSPAVADTIFSIPDLPDILSIVDVGSGDGSSIADVLEHIARSGRFVQELAMLDHDIRVFPDLVLNTVEVPTVQIDTSLVHTKDLLSVDSFLGEREGKYDLAIVQLVLHQIRDIKEIGLLLRHLYRFLKDDGNVIFIMLHKAYLDYLNTHFPNKFSYTPETNNTVGRYHFDGGGANDVYVHNQHALSTLMMANGFGPGVPGRRLYTNAVADKHPRYAQLAEQHIPMFGISPLKKEQKRMVVEIQGVVKRIREFKRGYIAIEFEDTSVYRMQAFPDWKEVKKGTTLIVIGAKISGSDDVITTYWLFDENNKMRSGQLLGEIGKV